MKEIKFVIPEQGEKILCNADELHNELLKLPAEMYVSLYHAMKHKMENSASITTGYTSASALLASACCSKR